MPDDSRTTTELPPIGDFDAEPAAVGGAPWETAARPGQPAGVPGDIELDDEWPVRSPRTGLRMRFPTAVLLALLIAAGGIWGGAALQRSRGTTTSGAGAAAFARLAGGFRGGTFAGRGGVGGASSSSAAAGIVTVVQGNILYVTTASGGLVKVVLGKTTTFTLISKSTVSGLRPGDTVIVQGTKAKNGNVAATSVAATAAGLSPAG
jgi:hypothetical protein